MAAPFQRGGKWYARVKDAGGAWRNVVLAEARTKAQAHELAADLALKARRQRAGLEPLPADKSFTVGKLIRWWLDEYVKGKTWAGREEDRLSRATCTTVAAASVPESRTRRSKRTASAAAARTAT